MNAVQVNMASGQGLHDCFDTLKDVDVIVNCAAISSPAACAKHPQHARSVLVPSPHEIFFEAACWEACTRLWSSHCTAAGYVCPRGTGQPVTPTPDAAGPSTSLTS